MMYCMGLCVLDVHVASIFHACLAKHACNLCILGACIRDVAVRATCMPHACYDNMHDMHLIYAHA